jgi:hypothetical protein
MVVSTRFLAVVTRTDPGPDLDETHVWYDSNWELGPVQSADVAAGLRYLPDPRARTADAAAFFDNSAVNALLSSSAAPAGRAA